MRKGEKAVVSPKKPKKKGIKSSEATGAGGYDQLWGRSTSAVSMVNKSLRGMAIKHVFTVSAKSFLFYQIASQADSLIVQDSATLESSR